MSINLELGGMRFCDPRMGQRFARERLCLGAVEKRTRPQTLIALLNILRFPTAPRHSRWPEAAHVWFAEAYPAAFVF
jgi:hypothetical protein